MNVKIQNSFLKVEANLAGGALSSIYDKRNALELLYDSWSGQVAGGDKASWRFPV